MMTVMLFASLLWKTYDMLSAMAFSAFLILLQNPLQIFSAGFLLSFGAVLGIAVFLPCLRKIFPGKNPLLNAILVSVSAMVATTPLILYFFYQFPAYSILVNLLILPFVTVLTLSSFIAGIVGVFYLPLGIFLIGGSNYILKLYEVICRINDMLPFSLITTGRPSGLLLSASAFLLIAFVITSRRYQKKASLILLILSIVILFVPQRNVGLELTMLDMGQGEALFMENSSGTSYLIDGGSADISKAGRYRLLPFLKYQGVGRIDYAIITHSDKDHVSAVTELLEDGQIKVERLLLPGIHPKDDNYLALEALARKKVISLGYINAGDRIKDGDMNIYCLHPSEDFTVTSANSYSTVLSISYGSFDLLLTGDLEETGEKLLTDRLSRSYFREKYGFQPASDYDVLKVAHHGSKYSSNKDFLSVVRPELSLISCGRDNWYGHPHPELLERLEAAGSGICITYLEGAITLRTDGRRLAVKKWFQ
jgi:competence protein ComEC